VIRTSALVGVVAAMAVTLTGAPVAAAPLAPTAAASSIAIPAASTVPCSDIDVEIKGVTCGRLDVPVDWFDANNPARGSIAYAVHRATAKKKLGTLTFNPGGPGQSGLAALRTFLGEDPLRPWARLPKSVVEQFDIVAWDPRGVGASTPALSNCGMASPTYGDLPATGPVDWLAATQAYSDSLSAILTACVAANPAVADKLGTAYVVRDLEALRSALRVSQWTYWGMSYGTQIGMAYAQAYPSRLRALVLDGTVPVNSTFTQRASMQTWGRLYSLDVFARSYGKGFAAKVDRVVAEFDKRTGEIGGESYSRWQTVASWLGLLNAQFNYGLVKKQVDLWYDALFRGTSAALITGPRAPEPDFSGRYLTFMVNCSDIAERPSVATIAGLAQSAADAGLTVAGRMVIERGIVCAGLPEGFGRPLPEITAPLRLPHSALVVNSVGDPFTQWLGAQQTAGFIQGARLISYMSSQHVTYRQVPAPCVDRPVTTYLLTTNRPRADLQCDFVVGRNIVIG
jgi:pimeloyl-ACP methyl ester carboxylesterase